MKSNSGKYVLIVLMGIIAVPTLSSIAPLAFATSPPESDTVTILDQQPITIPESEEGALVPVSTALFENADPTIISFQDPPGEHGGARTSDFLIYDPNHKICPQFPTGALSTVCFVSDDELGSIEPVIAQVQHFFTIIKIDETGVPQDVSSYFGFEANSGKVFVFSDVEINPQIPEFPIPFSMIIIFVAVAAVYMGIRQKMIPGFKSF